MLQKTFYNNSFCVLRTYYLVTFLSKDVLHVFSFHYGISLSQNRIRNLLFLNSISPFAVFPRQRPRKCNWPIIAFYAIALSNKANELQILIYINKMYLPFLILSSVAMSQCSYACELEHSLFKIKWSKTSFPFEWKDRVS